MKVEINCVVWEGLLSGREEMKVVIVTEDETEEVLLRCCKSALAAGFKAWA